MEKGQTTFARHCPISFLFELIVVGSGIILPSFAITWTVSVGFSGTFKVGLVASVTSLDSYKVAAVLGTTLGAFAVHLPTFFYETHSRQNLHIRLYYCPGEG